MKNVFVPSTSADIVECEDKEFLSQARNSKQITSEQEYTICVNNESRGLILKVVQKCISFVKSDSPSKDLERHPQRPHKSNLTGQSSQKLQVKGGVGKQFPKGETAQVAELTQKFNQAMQEKEAEWEAKGGQLKDQLGRMQSQNGRLESQVQQIQGELEHRTGTLEAKSEKKAVEVEYSLYVRKKQEEEFKGMDSWLPVEGSKVMGDLNRLKRDMRAFGKGMSTNDFSIFQRLDEADYVALMSDLTEVCALKNGEFPEGLTSSKAPALLPNALLANHVYKTLFHNPFFFLSEGLGNVLPISGLDSLLNEIYSRTQQANREEAHIWRSQTLRLLLPQLRDGATSQEKALHCWTSELISKVANLQATNFLQGPARHLCRDEARANSGSKLQSVYQSAARIS